MPHGLLCLHTDAETYAVVVKPAGFRTVPGRGAEENPAIADSVETRARALFGIPKSPVIVHRLDIETSGLVVIGKTRAAHRALSRQFMHRKVGKTYAALVEGHMDDGEGAVDLPLAVDWENRPRQHVTPEGRASRTLWRVISRELYNGRPVTRLAFRPVTGRTHQLRVHSATPVDQGGLGRPIVGDTLYNPEPGAPRMMLHADHLAFWHPEGGAWQKHDCPPPF